MRYRFNKVEARFAARIADLEGDPAWHDGPPPAAQADATPTAPRGDSGDSPAARIFALGVLTVLTTILCWATLGYTDDTPKSDVLERLANEACYHARIAEAADHARAAGDIAFAEWLEELP